MAFGRVDQRGRSTNKLTSRDKKVFNPPQGKDQPWAWLTVELMQSAAWRAMGLSARLLIDRIMIEHRAENGLGNGRLKVTHLQFAEHGVGKSAIRAAIEECEVLGLLQVDKGGRYNGSNKPSTYRLTFYATHDGSPPTNEWRVVTPEMIERMRPAKTKRMRSLANLKIGSGTPTDRGTVPRQIGVPTKPRLVKA